MLVGPRQCEAPTTTVILLDFTLAVKDIDTSSLPGNMRITIVRSPMMIAGPMVPLMRLNFNGFAGRPQRRHRSCC
jgi:hypothetical protein